MIRTREGDTLELKFTKDAKGLVNQEQVFRKSVGGEKIYYYYDEQGHVE
jgi:hypothetical protein